MVRKLSCFFLGGVTFKGDSNCILGYQDVIECPMTRESRFYQPVLYIVIVHNMFAIFSWVK